MKNLLFCLFLLALVPLYGQHPHYVLAPSGLNLRQGPALSDAKISKMPYGAKVTVMEKSTAQDMEVDNIPGTMVKVKYQGQVGYCFSGYLATFVAPEPPATDVGAYMEGYAEALRTDGHNILYEKINRDYGGYYQYEEALVLDAASFFEAFIVARQLFEIPAKINLPDADGEARQVVPNPDKKEHVWSDELTVERNAKGKILNASYYYRQEGGGQTVQIVPTEDSGFRISITFIAD